MKHEDEIPPRFRANRRAIVGSGLGIAAVAGLAAATGPAAPAKALVQEVMPAAATAEPGTMRVIGRGALPLAPDAASIMVAPHSPQNFIGFSNFVPHFGHLTEPGL